MFIPVDALLAAGTVIFALLVTGGFVTWACLYTAFGEKRNGVKPKMPTQKPVVAAPPPPPGV